MVARRLSCTFFRIGLIALSLMTVLPLRAAAIISVSLANTIPPNDDASSGAVALGIGGASGIDFFGTSFTNVFVNNNGNVTFGSPLSQFTPNGLAIGVGSPIIAPFFADVDTTGPGSGVVMYGNAVVNGLSAFVANYIDVGYFESQTNKLNSFQLILFDRSDTGSGNFDIEFNYDKILWETGQASGGVNGLGGISAAAGYSNGQSGGNNVFPVAGFPGEWRSARWRAEQPYREHSRRIRSARPVRLRGAKWSVVPPIGIPEPLSLALAGAGLISMGIFRRRVR